MTALPFEDDELWGDGQRVSHDVDDRSGVCKLEEWCWLPMYRAPMMAVEVGWVVVTTKQERNEGADMGRRS